MSNTKAKIIIGAGIVLVSGIVTGIVVRDVRRNRIRKRIFDQLNDTSFQGQGSNVGADEAHKFTLALDPNFWKKTSGSPLPTKLIPDKTARERARAINDSIGLWDDEDKILSEIKKAQTQGQLSQVAHAYANAPLNFGNLGDDLERALKGGLATKDRLKELNMYINSLPY
jgi:hypothetical protein